MTVRELGERMDFAEFLEWQSFDEVHTSDAWYQNGLLRMTIAGLFNGRVKLDDFLPDRRKLPPSPMAPFLAFAAWGAGHNARLKARGELHE